MPSPQIHHHYSASSYKQHQHQHNNNNQQQQHLVLPFDLTAAIRLIILYSLCVLTNMPLKVIIWLSPMMLTLQGLVDDYTCVPILNPAYAMEALLYAAAAVLNPWSWPHLPGYTLYVLTGTLLVFISGSTLFRVFCIVTFVAMDVVFSFTEAMEGSTHNNAAELSIFSIFMYAQCAALCTATLMHDTRFMSTQRRALTRGLVRTVSKSRIFSFTTLDAVERAARTAMRFIALWAFLLLMDYGLNVCAGGLLVFVSLLLGLRVLTVPRNSVPGRLIATTIDSTQAVFLSCVLLADSFAFLMIPRAILPVVGNGVLNGYLLSHLFPPSSPAHTTTTTSSTVVAPASTPPMTLPCSPDTASANAAVRAKLRKRSSVKPQPIQQPLPPTPAAATSSSATATTSVVSSTGAHITAPRLCFLGALCATDVYVRLFSSWAPEPAAVNLVLSANTVGYSFIMVLSTILQKMPVMIVPTSELTSSEMTKRSKCEVNNDVDRKEHVAVPPQQQRATPPVIQNESKKCDVSDIILPPQQQQTPSPPPPPATNITAANPAAPERPESPMTSPAGLDDQGRYEELDEDDDDDDGIDAEEEEVGEYEEHTQMHEDEDGGDSAAPSSVDRRRWAEEQLRELVEEEENKKAARTVRLQKKEAAKQRRKAVWEARAQEAQRREQERLAAEAQLREAKRREEQLKRKERARAAKASAAVAAPPLAEEEEERLAAVPAPAEEETVKTKTNKNKKKSNKPSPQGEGVVVAQTSQDTTTTTASTTTPINTSTAPDDTTIAPTPSPQQESKTTESAAPDPSAPSSLLGDLDLSVGLFGRQVQDAAGSLFSGFGAFRRTEPNPTQAPQMPSPSYSPFSSLPADINTFSIDPAPSPMAAATARVGPSPIAASGSPAPATASTTTSPSLSYFQTVPKQVIESASSAAAMTQQQQYLQQQQQQQQQQQAAAMAAAAYQTVVPTAVQYVIVPAGYVVQQASNGATYMVPVAAVDPQHQAVYATTMHQQHQHQQHQQHYYL
eukprot:PhM_4_TR4644/c0_g1_i1/m.12849